ncbi:WSC-domain-containing protein [Aureobasidium sp. EXF-12298]|nr:WSC-domain-containing protein [Aureobasidium sp. EXF-12298]KAI4750337.1 WSC-domain-containing protein [Aureobasidium sp. EXF-12344]
MLSTMRSVAAITLALSALSVQTVSAIVAGPVTDAGCFDDSTGLDDNGVFNYQSKGHCQEICISAGSTVMAMTNANECWCGSSLPPKSSLQSDNSKCNKACVGYPSDVCGGDGYWSVYFTTTDTDISYSGGGGSSGAAASSASSSSSAAAAKSSSASSSSSSAAAAASTTSATSASSASDKATVITSIAPGKTVIITQTPSAAQATSTSETVEKSKKGGSNTAGIAAGVVVGIVVIAALIGAAFFFWRRKQRREAETGHQQLNDYSNASQKPMAFRPASGPDSRIDPHAMASRRQSDGSIADNEDYSRRILKVTNA